MRTPSQALVSIALATAFCMPANAGFFGPTTALIKDEALLQKMQSQTMVVDVSAGSLEVRTKAAAIGGFLIGFIASSAMASGGGMPSNMNAQQLNQNMQANMQIATEFNKNFQTAFTSVAASQAAKPTGQVGQEGPITLVVQQLAASLAQNESLKTSYLQPNEKPKARDLQLRITQPQWLLDYSMASSDYNLSHRIEVSLYQQETDTLFFKHDCQGTAESKMPKEDWEKDDFAAVASAAVDAGNKCALKVIAALGLQPAKVEAAPLTPQATALPPVPVIATAAAEPVSPAQVVPAPPAAVVPATEVSPTSTELPK